jgi:hypothetical protein
LDNPLKKPDLGITDTLSNSKVEFNIEEISQQIALQNKKQTADLVLQRDKQHKEIVESLKEYHSIKIESLGSTLKQMGSTLIQLAATLKQMDKRIIELEVENIIKFEADQKMLKEKSKEKNK